MLREGCGRGWGGAGRSGGAGAGPVGEDGLHGDGILHEGGAGQTAPTAGTAQVSAPMVEVWRIPK